MRENVGALIVIMTLFTACAPSTSNIQTAIAQTQIALPTTTQLPTLNPSSTPTQTEIPIANSVYFGIAEGNNAIFLTENHQQDIYKNLGFKSNQYLGWLYYEFYKVEVFNFTGLEKPQLLFSIPDLNQWMEVTYNLDQMERKYISGTRGVPSNTVNFIYVVNLDTGVYQEIWTRADFPIAYLYVHDKFLEISISWCYGCDSPPHPRTIILNTVSGNTLELGEVGNVIVDVNNNTVSYQYLTRGNSGSYEPTGDLLVKTLP